MMTADQISSPTLVASEPISKKTVWASWAIFAQELCHLLLLSPSHGNLWFPSSFSWIQGGMQIVIDGWFKALKCKLFCRADAFISVAKGSDIWQSAISALSIHTFRKHKSSKQMHKWSAEERPWGLWDISKMHLSIDSLPSLHFVAYWLVTLFHRRMCLTSLPVTHWNMGLPACAALSWDTATGWWGALQPSLCPAMHTWCQHPWSPFWCP